MVKQCFLCRKTNILNPEITFHRFPTDENSKKKWLVALRDEEKQLTHNSLICSDHFNKTKDFVIKDSGRVFLKKGAVPSPAVVDKSAIMWIEEIALRPWLLEDPIREPEEESIPLKKRLKSDPPEYIKVEPEYSTTCWEPDIKIKTEFPENEENVQIVKEERIDQESHFEEVFAIPFKPIKEIEDLLAS